jgi:acyl-coenzyme A synthetase/AMP-(fatty) acid ligase
VAPAIVSARADCPQLSVIVVVGKARRGALPYERLLERASPHLAAADTSRDDVAMWGYTSGSTGQPKAAVHSAPRLRALRRPDRPGRVRYRPR